MAESTRYNQSEGGSALGSNASEKRSSLLKKKVSIAADSATTPPPRLDKSVLEKMASTFFERVKETGKC